jgi:class 3 adenylate cyclase
VAAVGPCPVLVRRDEQLAALEDALLESRRGEGRLVVLAGEAGIGKTRLAVEVARQARRLGSAVLWGGCSEAELSLPYLPFVEAIGNHLADEDVEALAARLGPMARELSQLFPQFGDGSRLEAPSDPGQAKLRLFEAIVSLLAMLARDRTLVLVVEDVHWADDSSRELIDHIARRLSGLRALAVVTYRTDELHRRHPFLPTLRAWRRSDLAEVIELEPLPEGGVAEMVAAITGAETIDDDLLELLYQRSEGNPFFLEEMVGEAAVRLGAGSGWSRRAVEGIGIPETVRDTILQRLARLDPEQAATLEAAAVLGRTFDYPVLLAVAERGPDVVEAALGAAISQQLVEEPREGQGRFTWRHALTQEAIYDEIVTPRRQGVHSRAADVLSRSDATPAVELAYHLLGAARFEEAVPICMRSADEAERAVAFREAASVLERALPHVRDPVEHARLVCRIGHDYALNSEPGVAQGFLADGIAELDRLGEIQRAARYRVILGRCYWERAQPEPARREYEQARDVLVAAGPSPELAMVHVRLAGLHAFELEYQRCLEAARDAVAIAEEAGADFERVYALGFLGLGYHDSGESARGFEVMDACYEEARAKDYWLIAQNVTWNDIWTRVHMRRGGLESRVERFGALPWWPLISLTQASARSYVRAARGDLAGAREDAEQGIVLNERLGYRKMVWRCRVQLAEVLAELGRYDEAQAVLPPRSERTELQDIVYDAAALIRTALGRGEVSEAIEVAREILEHGDRFTVYRGPLALATEAFAAAGDVEGAENALAYARSHPSDPAPAFVDEIEGRVLLARDEGSAARPALGRALELAESAGYALAAMRARLLLADAEGRDGDLDAAAATLGSVVTEAARTGARLIADEAAAVADRLGVALPEAASELAPSPREPEIVPTGERLMTSLFADVRGYTSLSATDAPAEIGERMAGFYRFARTAVERHSGIVDKFAGDAVMASFNVSGRSIDHTLGALQAALTLRDKAALMELPVGIGIATGAAIVGRGASDENIAVWGQSTNLAARLQTAAAAGEILLSEEAHRRVAAWLRDHGLESEREELELKGFAGPQAAYRLAAPSSIPVRTSQTSDPIRSRS